MNALQQIRNKKVDREISLGESLINVYIDFLITNS